MKKILVIFFAFYSINLFGQDLKKIEAELQNHLKKIKYWGSFTGNNEKMNSLDSLQKENEIFLQKLLDYTAKQPLTLTYDFKDLQKESLTIASSADKKFRIYSWDTEAGGTMHFFKNVYQYQAGNKVFSRIFKTEEGDGGGWFSQIFSLNRSDKNIYLGYFNAIYSTRDVYQAVKFFTITNNDLNNTSRFIKTESGLNNELGFNFDFSSVADRKERPVKLIYFDSAQKTIRIPIVTSKSQVTNKFIVYKFTGKYFERK